MSHLHALRHTVARLRAPDGCPWDREQTHQTLTTCLVDEVSEVLDTLDRADWPHLREELGDVLLQIVLHAQIASEAGNFDLEDVAREINEKLIRRHPHVFGEQAKLGNSAAVLVEWDKIKAAEKAAAGKPAKRFKEAPPRLPSLHFARDVAKIAQKHSLDLTPFADDKRVAAQAQGLTEEAAGKALFEFALACRRAGVDAEAALRRHAAKVVDHYETMA